MNFGQAIQSGFRNYANFSGRSSRSEAAYWLLFNCIVGLLTGIIDGAIFGVGVLIGTNALSSLILLLPGLALGFRRLHDIGKSGWNYLWLLTIIGIFPLIYWTYFKPGDEGENAYGPNPLLSAQEDGEADDS